LSYTLSKQAEQAGHKLRFFAECGSTNDEAKIILEENIWIVTNTQTKGRGSRQREWLSPPQNLAASFTSTSLCPTAALPQLCFVAGLALIYALKKLLPFEDFYLKWPNDILLHNAKLSGILIEAVTQGEITQTIIGWGVNINSSPQDLPYKTSHLQGRVTREELFNALTQSFVETLELWQKGDGFENIKNEWLKYAAHFMQTLTVTQQNEQITGKFIALTPQGGLRLHTEFGIKEIYAGEIIVPRL
jgi:BirA family transcriptional regulator, biotin operon repressor / biotin---[acetyl-CoA-carboxylase] ligase